MRIKYKFTYHKNGTLPPEPYSDWIFVFGSNLRGRHGLGAAKIAKELFNAEEGIPIGLTGNSYAIPTKDRFIRTLNISIIKAYIETFCNFTYNRPKLKFFVTAVGCGLAGYKSEQIAPFFKDANPENCSFPDIWKHILR